MDNALSHRFSSNYWKSRPLLEVRERFWEKPRDARKLFRTKKKNDFITFLWQLSCQMLITK